MPNVLRNDGPGTWHHVMNRGLAHRTVFESRDDVRHFLFLIARAVRRGEIEIHSYSFLPTHYHLLLRSLRGELSHTMMWIQNLFVRRFNGRRQRDGPLFQGRFRSRIITSDVYWRTVVRYIDLNAVSAGLVASGSHYPHCSAFHYVRESGPPWLARRAVEGVVLWLSRRKKYVPSLYNSAFSTGEPDFTPWVVEQRLLNRQTGEDPLDFLIRASPDKTRKWMARQAFLADGTAPGQTLVDPRSLLARIAAHRSIDPVWMVRPAKKDKPGWTVLAAGLLRMLCGLECREISQRLRCGETSACRYVRDHRGLFMNDDEYASLASRILNESLEACFAVPRGRKGKKW
jgi:hypothetical protein